MKRTDEITILHDVVLTFEGFDDLDGSNPCKYTCEKCGKVNAIESNYCSECGNKL